MADLYGDKKHCTFVARVRQQEDGRFTIEEVYSDFKSDDMKEYVRSLAEFTQYSFTAEEMLKENLKFELNFKPSDENKPIRLKLTVHDVTLKIVDVEKTVETEVRAEIKAEETLDSVDPIKP
ncbi:hypothetical protein RF11_15728 [Thelohanellus kitauei]|uniref:Uncharacterized protein n=1 Tax=Thelohanellus kitauei TaxID=669202 RepID=A0A0C2IX72_THEKT|nr:hypothetical protein RF11_15728 [Thelohanellus kitauei]